MVPCTAHVEPDHRWSGVFLKAGSEILRINHHTRLLQLFQYNFKYSPSRCAVIFLSIRGDRLLPQGYEPKHLLWTLYFLVTYVTERQLCCILHADRKTIRKYLWPTISAIARLLPRHVSEKFHCSFVLLDSTSHV